MEVFNAIIIGAQICIQRDVLTVLFDIKYSKEGVNGYSQSFGGLGLYSREFPQTDSCGKYLNWVMDTLGVERFDSILGKHIRIKVQDDKIVAIGDIMYDRWFNHEDFLKY